MNMKKLFDQIVSWLSRFKIKGSMKLQHALPIVPKFSNGRYSGNNEILGNGSFRCCLLLWQDMAIVCCVFLSLTCLLSYSAQEPTLFWVCIPSLICPFLKLS